MAHVDHLKRAARQPYTDEETAVETTSTVPNLPCTDEKTDVETTSTVPDLPQAVTTTTADTNEYRKKLRSYKGDEP